MTLVPLSRLVLCLAFASGPIACGGKKETPAEESPSEGSEAVKHEGESEDAASEPAEDAATTGETHEPGKRKNARDRLTGRRPPPRGRDKLGDHADGEPSDGEVAGTEKEPKEPGDTKPESDAEEPKPDVKIAEPKPDLKAPDGKTDPAMPTEPPPVELHKPEPVVHTTPLPLEAQRIMPLQAVIDATQAKGLNDAGTLPGIAIGPGYVSILYKGPAADKFGVALQAWQDPARREADDRFRRMRLQYPNAEDVQVLQPAKAFFAHFGGIQMLTFVDSVKRIVATVSCGEEICTHDQLSKLAKSVREKL